MPSDRRDPANLSDMLCAAEAVGRFVAGRTYADLLADEMLQASVERKIETIGEADRRVSVPFQTAHPILAAIVLCMTKTLIMLVVILFASCGRAPSAGTTTSAPPETQSTLNNVGIWRSVQPPGLEVQSLAIDRVTIANDGRRIAWCANAVGISSSHAFFGVISLENGASFYHGRLDFFARGIALNQDGSRLLIAGNGVRCLDMDGKVVWDVESGVQFESVFQPMAGLVLAAEEKRVLLLDAETGAIKKSFAMSDPSHTFGNMSVSQDGSHLMLTSSNTVDEFLNRAPVRNLVYILEAKSLTLRDTVDIAALQSAFRPDALSNDGTMLFVHENSADKLGGCSLVSTNPRALRKFSSTVPARNMLGGSIFPAFSNDARTIYVAGYLDKTAQGISSSSDTLLAFDTSAGTLAREFDSLPPRHFIMSSSIKPSLNLAVFGVRNEQKATKVSRIFWTSTNLE